MNRRHLLSGAAYLLGAAQANAFGIGRLGLGEGSLGSLGGAGIPAPPTGFVYLLGADGVYLKGADGAYLLGAA